MFSRGCRDKRLSSWHAFLDDMARIDGHLDVQPPHRGTFPGRPADPDQAEATPRHCDVVGARDAGSANCPGPWRERRGFDVWIGPRSARVVFDLGDGDLNWTEIVYALDVVREQVLPHLPVRTELGAIAAGYYNAEPQRGCTANGHEDHLAVQLALYFKDFRLPGPQWGRWPACNPLPPRTTPRVDDVDLDTNHHAMVVSGGRAHGALQRRFGWLQHGSWSGDGEYHHHQVSWVAYP
jgi:hypothetical protein